MTPLTLAQAQDLVACYAPRPYYAETYYAETYRGYEASYLPEVAARVLALPPGRVIDVGPGWGTMAVLLASHGWAVSVVDFLPLGTFITPSLLDETGIQYHQCAVETDDVLPPLPPADLLLMTMVFGHLRYRPDNAIRRVSPWLAHDGLFVCANIDTARCPPVAHAYPDWHDMPVPGDGAATVDDLVTCMLEQDDYAELLEDCFDDVTVVPSVGQAMLHGVCCHPRR
jgi:cyclopropane fatty-acyl-phospholipid synthase-like methyltransferase